MTGRPVRPDPLAAYVAASLLANVVVADLEDRCFPWQTEVLVTPDGTMVREGLVIGLPELIAGAVRLLEKLLADLAPGTEAQAELAHKLVGVTEREQLAATDRAPPGTRPGL
jgi:hypothetical protein